MESSTHDASASRREELVDEVGIKTASVNAPITSLSGGNQQKVVIGRWLFADTKILLLDDPTVGVDVAAKDEIYRLVLRLADAGSGVIVCSSELDELLTLADRIMVLHRGAIVASVPVHGAEAETPRPHRDCRSRPHHHGRSAGVMNVARRLRTSGTYALFIVICVGFGIIAPNFATDHELPPGARGDRTSRDQRRRRHVRDGLGLARPLGRRHS